VTDDTDVLWKLKSHVPRYASPILVDGLLYMVADESFVTCAEAASGQTCGWNGLAENTRHRQFMRTGGCIFSARRGDDGDQAGPDF